VAQHGERRWCTRAGRRRTVSLGADSHKNSWPFGSIATFHNGAI